MPIIKSAKKRTRVARKATVRNAKTKRSLRTALKAFQSAVTGGKKSPDSHSRAQSELDKAAKKGVIHKNKAARKKRQLAAQAKAAGIKTAGSKKTVKSKSTTAKKTASAKKPAAKKPSVKKSPAKKTTKK
jgi:small subunit ribosomal protein S20